MFPTFFSFISQPHPYMTNKASATAPAFPIRFLHTIGLHRRYLAKATAAGLVIGLLIALSIPKEYVASLLLSPESISKYVESTDTDWTGDIVERSKERDAITPDFYPHIASSPSFLAALFGIPVQSTDCPADSTLTLYDYMDRHQRRPWWGFVQTSIGKITGFLAGSFLERPEKTRDNHVLPIEGTETQPGIFALSEKDFGIATAINRRIQIKPDVESHTVSIACRMQDPLIAAAVADTIGRRIQAYVTEYRTRKEREELAAAKRLQEETREKYYQAQEAQAAFEDRNRALATKDAQKEAIRLRILTRQAREAYARATLQVHAAETQVIRVRPVFAVIQPPTAPVRPVSPSKLKYMTAFALLGFAAGYARLWLRKKGKNVSR